MLKKIIMLLTIMLITTISVSAQEETTYKCPDGFVVSINNNCISTSTSITITPDSPLYDLKLWFEDLQETLTFNDAKKLSLKQEHLQNRMNELRYDMLKGNNKNTEKLMQKIQIKQLELIADSTAGEESVKRSTVVLTNLLNDTRMPEQSRKGLENAVNKTILSMNRLKISIKNNNGSPEIINIKIPKTIKEEGERINISANMVQGTYTANPQYLSLLPFTNVAVLDPNEDKWYTITIENDKIIILDYLNRDTPQYYLYPTSSQLSSLESIARKINKNGITIKDKIQLLKLWYNIKKVEN